MAIHGAAYRWLDGLERSLSWSVRRDWSTTPAKHAAQVGALAEIADMLHDWDATHAPWVAFYRGLDAQTAIWAAEVAERQAVADGLRARVRALYAVKSGGV